MPTPAISGPAVCPRRAPATKIAITTPRDAAGVEAFPGETDRALEWAQQAFARADGNPYVADTLGWLYLENGLATRAVGLLEEARAGIPGHPVVELHLALAYRADGQPERARELLTDLEVRSRQTPALHAEVQEALHSIE